MNQILSTQNMSNKGNNRGTKTKDIKSVIKFFAFMLIIFGIFLIANSAYGMYKNGSFGTEEKAIEKAEIVLENKGDTQVIIKIMQPEHDRVEIDQLTYYWNNETPTVKNGNNRTYMEETIDIPKGENTLTVKLKDARGQVVEQSKTYLLESNINIETEQTGNSVKVTITSNDDLDKVLYKLDSDDEEEAKVDGKECTFDVEIPIGEHKLAISAIDVNGIEEEKKATFKGSSAPTVKVSKGDNCYVITAHDDEGIDKIEIVTLKDGKVLPIKSDGKDFEYEYPVYEGDDNLIKIIAYNSNGVQSKPVAVKWKK